MEMKLGNMDRARAVYERGIEARCRGMASVWQGLGCLETSLGNKDKAREVNEITQSKKNILILYSSPTELPYFFGHKTELNAGALTCLDGTRNDDRTFLFSLLSHAFVFPLSFSETQKLSFSTGVPSWYHTLRERRGEFLVPLSGVFGAGEWQAGGGENCFRGGDRKVICVRPPSGERTVSKMVADAVVFAALPRHT